MIGAASTPSSPATPLASSVFTIESWFVDNPASPAATSFSAAARVARPNRLHR